MNTSIVVALVTSIFALVAAIVSGLISYFSTKQTTKVAKQKHYFDFLQLKMNKLEEVQNLFDSGISADDPTTGLAKIASDRNGKTSRFLTVYEYLFTHTRAEYEQLVKDSHYNSLCYGIHVAHQNNLTVDSEEIKDLPEPGVVVDNILKTANAFQKLVTKELAATYKDFEGFTK